jgi:hypothetical protein
MTAIDRSTHIVCVIDDRSGSRESEVDTWSNCCNCCAVFRCLPTCGLEKNRITVLASRWVQVQYPTPYIQHVCVPSTLLATTL